MRYRFRALLLTLGVWAATLVGIIGFELQGSAPDEAPALAGLDKKIPRQHSIVGDREKSGLGATAADRKITGQALWLSEKIGCAGKQQTAGQETRQLSTRSGRTTLGHSSCAGKRHPGGTPSCRVAHSCLGDAALRKCLVIPLSE